MSLFDRKTLLGAGAAGLDGDPNDFRVAADRCLSLGDEAGALTALDRAFGLAPDDVELASMRATLLDRFAVEEHGLRFRYVPAGTFLMGSTTGDPDERPVHPVTLDAFWIAEVPMTWSAFCELAGWSQPPRSFPPRAPHDDEDESEADRNRYFRLIQLNKICAQYCESESERAQGWHAHVVDDDASLAFLESAPRERSPAYDQKPMVAVDWLQAEQLAERLSAAAIAYALPSEAEWEKAARGGRIGQRYPWGDEPPTSERCDFNHFGDFRIADPRSFPVNGYGLHGMSGGVWEWTSTVYDALAYAGATTGAIDPRLLDLHGRQPADDEPQQRVVRGGSWTDAAAAVTVSFRHAMLGGGWERTTPNVGFRLVRRALTQT